MSVVMTHNLKLKDVEQGMRFLFSMAKKHHFSQIANNSFSMENKLMKVELQSKIICFNYRLLILINIISTFSQSYVLISPAY